MLPLLRLWYSQPQISTSVPAWADTSSILMRMPDLPTILDARSWMLDPGSIIQNPGYNMQNPASAWTFERGLPPPEVRAIL